jgi:hypothetical protein
MTERWLPIPGYEGRYDVSDQGRVRSWTRSLRDPHLLRQHLNGAGYLQVKLCRDRAVNTARVHLLVLLAFVGPRADGLVCRHLDGDSNNNVLSNLRYGTYAENAQDRVRHGTDAHARRTHCNYGHPFDAANTWVNPTGGERRCRTCMRARNREWVARRRLTELGAVEPVEVAS